MPFTRSHKKMRLRISFIRVSLTSGLLKVKPSIGMYHGQFEPRQAIAGTADLSHCSI